VLFNEFRADGQLSVAQHQQGGSAVRNQTTSGTVQTRRAQPFEGIPQSWVFDGNFHSAAFEVPIKYFNYYISS